ncbi:hypothetical protein BDW74DRAFT_155268 [Aspergillus multicolor]|uniref:uncharacterized protein n=1 Tax=Aspergillus multicolor TaxID=41759 RepID=UPI003CCD5237
MQKLFPQARTLGLRVLHTPSKPVFDVVFVHGLNGRSDRTFFHPGKGVYWPVHLLPIDLPSARILAFGYDADLFEVKGSISGNYIQDHARNLVRDLAGTRRDNMPVSALHHNDRPFWLQ